MRRTPSVSTGLAFVTLALLASCKSNRQMLLEELQTQLPSYGNFPSELCGYAVSGLSNVSVTGLTFGDPARGRGTATVVGSPSGPNTRPDWQCAGRIEFDYFRGQRTVNGRRQGAAMAVMSPRVISRAGARPDRGTPRTITLGQTVSGTLEAGDEATPGGTPADNFLVSVPAGLPMTLVARRNGGELDPMIVLLLNDIELARDDDSAGSLNSRVVFVPPTSGTYTIRVTAVGSGRGAYTLVTMPRADPTAQ
jgi:hypothetical protein